MITRDKLVRAEIILLAIACVALSNRICLGTETSISEAGRVLVIVNAGSVVSENIADYYQNKRPGVRQLYLNNCPVSEEISRQEFNNYLRIPISDWLQENDPGSEICYLVTTKGIPLKIREENVNDTSWDRSSVDSELCLLLASYEPEGWVRNQYFASVDDFFTFRSQLSEPVFLVTRLTGYQTDNDGDGLPDDVKALIDRAQGAVSPGIFILDEDPTKQGAYENGNTWMDFADLLLTDLGCTVVHDETTAFLTGQSEVLGYCSWGSNDSNHANHGEPYNSWVDRAIACDYVSTSARSFNFPPVYGQSLTADLIHEGVSGCSGYVYEPQFSFTTVTLPYIFFSRYMSGYNLAESYYMATYALSWQGVIVGDPLMTSESLPGRLSGRVTLEGRTNHTALITFELRLPGETIPLSTYNPPNDEDPVLPGVQITTESDGSFTLVDIPAGVYDLTAKAVNSLRGIETSITVWENSITSEIDFGGYLLGGDANGDNWVTGSDFFILRLAYGSSEGSPNWNESADFNGDGWITGIDFFIMKNNYGLSGA